MRVRSGVPKFTDGLAMHNWIDCGSSPLSVMLWFYRYSVELAEMTNIQVFLLDSSMKMANVELEPFFPALSSWQITKEKNGDKYIFCIDFEKGRLEFIFSEAFHVVSTKKSRGNIQKDKQRHGMEI